MRWRQHPPSHTARNLTGRRCLTIHALRLSPDTLRRRSKGQGDGGGNRIFRRRHRQYPQLHVGLLLGVITLGIYYWFWYYIVNDELKDIGVSKNDQKLGTSSPGMALAAVTIGHLLIVPPLISVFNYGKRIKRAQGLCGIPMRERISPTVAFLLAFPFGIFLIPLFFHYWYVTKHQNRAVRAAGVLTPEGDTRAALTV